MMLKSTWLFAVLATTTVFVLQQVTAQNTPAPTTNAVTAPVAAAPVATTETEAGEVTTVTVSANAFDARTDDSGCTPDGCTAGNTRDGDLTDNSRWSCSAELVEAAGGAVGEECQIIYEFAEVQEVASVSVAFLKGDERTRTLAVNVNGELLEVVESGGITSELESFELGAGAGAPGVLTLGLESQGLAADDFLSIIEVEVQVLDSVVSPPTGAPLTPAPVDVTAAPVAAVPAPVTAVPATAAPVADVIPNTISPVVDEVVTPVPASTPLSGTTPAPGFSSSIAPNTRDLGITPSPAAGGSAAGSGTSSEGEAAPSGVTISSSTSDSCFDYCFADEACLECTDSNLYEAEWDACVAEFEVEAYCDSYYVGFCCWAAVSPNDCMAMESYVTYMECTLEENGCSVDDMSCAVVSDWDFASSPTAETTSVGSDSSMGSAPGATPAPVLSSSSGTSARDLEITPSPATESPEAGTGVTSGDERSTSSWSSTSYYSGTDPCLACYYDDECMACIALHDDQEAEYEACTDEAVLEDFCDAIFAPSCCRKAVVGAECMAVEMYAEYLDCLTVISDSCSIDDVTCFGITGIETTGTDSGSAAATFANWSSIALLFALISVSVAMQ